MMRSTRSRRVAALLGTAGLAAGLLAACSSGETPSGDATGTAGGDGAVADTISITSNLATGDATGDYFKVVAENFEKESGIHIDIHEVPNDDLAPVFEADSLAGKQTDMVILNLTPTSGNWFTDGLVVDVAQYVDEWGLTDKIQDSAIQYWTANGGLNGFPYFAFNWPVWYNMDLLGQVGYTEVPQTWDELIDLSTKLRAAGIQPMAMGGNSWPVQNFISWMGQQYLTADEAIDVFSNGGWCASENAVKGLDLLGQLRDQGVLMDDVEGYDDTQQNTAYYNGEAAMSPLGSWNYTQAPEDIAAVSQLGGFPVVDGGTYDKPTAFQGHGAGFWVTTKGAEKLSAIQQFVTYLYSEPVLQGWVSEANQILSTTAEAIGDATSEAPLVVQGNALTSDVVDFLVLPDGYFPAGIDLVPDGAWFLGTDGATGADLCQRLDTLYQDLG